MQRTWIGAGALALSALLLAGLAFAGSLRQRGLPAQPETPCVVAELGGATLTQREVEAMTAAVTPAPAPAEASRLLVDATLAHWVVRGFVAGSSVRARLASYRALSAHLATRAPQGSLAARALLAVLARAGQELSLRAGPCYAAPEQPAPALAAVGAGELAALRATPRALEMRALAQAGKRQVARPVLLRLAPRLERIAPGPLFIDELEPALARALQAAAPGRWHGPISSESGLYLARLEDEAIAQAPSPKPSEHSEPSEAPKPSEPRRATPQARP